MDPAKAAFFIRTGPNVFAPTNMTIGPWDANSQHGGPPAALAAHMIVDSSKADGKFLLSKFSFHLYRPVPVAKQLRVQVKPIQQSKNVWHVEAVLTHRRQAGVPGRAIAGHGPPEAFHPLGEPDGHIPA